MAGDDAASPVHHLLTVWNPSYARDAMEQHLALLLDLARQCADRRLDPDDRYVWWGKVRSPNRQQRYPHAGDIRAIAGALAADGGDALEVQLYLTDYRSLYVADVGEIVEGELEPDEERHVPAYYGQARLSCDFWFLLADIRLLVADDLPGVVAELKQLRNAHYHDKPVSIYGGMVDLPLVVTRPDGRRFFDVDERDVVTGGALWAQWDAEQGAGVAATEAELRDDLFGDTAWRGLEPTARRFVATGEKLFREHRTDPAFDFGPVIAAFAKALEVQCRAVLRHAVAGLPPRGRQANVEGRTVDLSAAPSLTLGQIAHVLAGERALVEGVNGALKDRGWFAGSLPVILDEFVGVRNPAVHEARVDRATALHWRNRLLGVGCEGDLVRLGKYLARE